MSDDKLKPLRDQIDEIDAHLLALLNERARVAQQVGHVKAETNAPVFRPEREAQVLARIADTNPGPLLSSDLQSIFREVMSASEISHVLCGLFSFRARVLFRLFLWLWLRFRWLC